MSSVLRFFKQTPSVTFNSRDDPTELWLGSTIKTYADGSGAVFTNTSVYTFPTMTDLQGCLNALANDSDITINSLVAVRDMGKRIYLGVEGQESEMVVFALVQVIQGGGLDTVGYVCVQDVTDTLEAEVALGAY